jgi:hypothetical protein
MPYNENFISPGSITPNYPGTNNPVTHSFEERQLIAEFDDALIDQKTWKNSRYDGSKLTATTINKFTSGDESYQNQPVLMNQTTAIYLADSVISGEGENTNFATIKNHSYVNINKILLINPITNQVQLIDKATEPFVEFQRFITSDFETGTKCTVKIIDDTAASLQNFHRVKMNKGKLLKSFEFNFAGETRDSSSFDNVLTENNSMYLYKSGSLLDNFARSGSVTTPQPDGNDQTNALRFRYGIISLFNAGVSNATASGDGFGHAFDIRRAGPSFASSSILENKFTLQYYSGAFGTILHQPLDYTASSNSDTLNASGLGSASRFLGIDTLNFLTDNVNNNNLSVQEKTEVHITFFKGTKDFAPGFHDERSIGTFEVDQNIANLMIEQGDTCNGGLPTNHELVFKGRDDGRFLPTLSTFADTFQNAHLESSSITTTGTLDSNGCASPGAKISGSINDQSTLGTNITLDKVTDIQCYVQGGALGVIGHTGDITGSDTQDQGTLFAGSASGIGSAVPQSQVSLASFMTIDGFYSGSFEYEMSFLDKDHTLILNLNKNTELENGIGSQGVVIIPQTTIAKVANNVEFYLAQAGIIQSTVTLTQDLSTTDNPPPGV